MSEDGTEGPQPGPPQEPRASEDRTREPFWDMKASHWAQALLAFAIFCVGIAQVIVYVKQAHVMKGQLIAMQGQLNETHAATIATNEQLAIQRETFNRAYRPRIEVDPVSVGDITITKDSFNYNVTFIFRNYGTLPAEDIESSIELLTLDKAPGEQDRLCRQATAFETLHLDSLAKKNLPQVYDVIPANEPSPMQRSFPGSKPRSDFVPDPPVEDDRLGKGVMIPGQVKIPAVVGCVAYQGADDKKVHFTRFLYWLKKRTADGGTDFITADPQTIPAANVVLRLWPDTGNSQD